MRKAYRKEGSMGFVLKLTAELLRVRLKVFSGAIKVQGNS